MKKILIINPFGVGDVLFSTPLVKALDKRYPGAVITYICNKRAYGIIKDNPRISNIYIFEKDDYRRLWKESRVRCLRSLNEFLGSLRRQRYDVAIDMSLGYQASLLICLFVRIPHRIGFNYRNRGRFLNERVELDGFRDRHVIEYYLDLGARVGVDTSDKEMELFVSEADKAWAAIFLASHGVVKGDRLLGLIPGCGASWGPDAKYRRWSPWKFAVVADHAVASHGCKVIVFGEDRESHIARAVSDAISSRPIQACGRTTLGQFAALLERCDLVVTNDGGPLHIAVSLKRPTIAIYGPVDEKIYGPYPRGSRFVTVAGDVPCRPCYRNFKHANCASFDCLDRVKPADVIRHLDNFMKDIYDESNAGIPGHS